LLLAELELLVPPRGDLGGSSGGGIALVVVLFATRGLPTAPFLTFTVPGVEEELSRTTLRKNKTSRHWQREQ